MGGLRERGRLFFLEIFGRRKNVIFVVTLKNKATDAPFDVRQERYMSVDLKKKKKKI